MAQGLREATLIRSGLACNNACRFCAQAEERRSGGERAERPAQVVLEEARSVEPGGVVVFSGGEVTLRRELVTWVEAAKSAGARTVIVQTNGRMLSYKKLVKRLVKAGVDVFAVALHGHRAELHDWLTRVDGSFEQAMVGIRNVQSCGGVVYVNTVITRSNFRHLPDIAKLLPSWGAAGIRFIQARQEGDAVGLAPSLLPHPELVAPYLEQAGGIARALNRHVSIEASDEALNKEAHHVVTSR